MEDILDFLGQRVRERLVSSQINESNIQKVRSKDKMTLNECESELDSISRKLR